MLVAVAELLVLDSAYAQASVFEDFKNALRIDAGASCLARDTLAEHVASWLGTTPIDARLSVTVHGNPAAARAVWFRVERAGTLLNERHFEPGPARCEDLHAAVGLAIALAIKASLLDSFTPPNAVPHTERTVETPGWGLGIDALASYSLVPGAAFGAGLQVQRRLIGSLGARLGLLGVAGPDRDFPQSAGRFDIWLLSSRLDVCDTFDLSTRVRLSACLGIALGGLYVRGRALSPSRAGHERFLAFTNALEVALDLNATWSIQIALNVLFPVRRIRVVVRDAAGKVAGTNDLAAVGGFLSVGPRLRF